MKIVAKEIPVFGICWRLV